MAIDEAKLNAFMGKIVGDLGVTMSSALLVLGDRLGLYQAMAALGPQGRWAPQTYQVGGAFFRLFTVSLNYANSRVYLVPNRAGRTAMGIK